MHCGTIIFFSDENGVAHIWCDDAENPLFRARQADFPELWPRLKTGDRVSLVAAGGPGMQYAKALQLVPDPEE